jgi:hypothetical protein
MAWTRAAVRAAAEELNNTDPAQVRNVMVATFTAGNPRSIETMMHLLDQAMKLSPVLLPVIRSVIVGTTVPEPCQAIILHWAQLRLVPLPAKPPVHGYFHWKKMARLAGVKTQPMAEAHTALIVASAHGRQTCHHCHEAFLLVFSDVLNEWTLAGAVSDGARLFHVDCTPEAVEKWALG